MNDHLAMLAGFYWEPHRAALRILDGARLGWSIGMALAVALALWSVG